MYSSHGSSGRIGTGFRRGHGGGGGGGHQRRRKKKDNGADGDGKKVPPPLKQCHCLVQVDVPEYLHDCVSIELEIQSQDQIRGEGLEGGHNSPGNGGGSVGRSRTGSSDQDVSRGRTWHQHQQTLRSRLHLCFDPKRHRHHHQPVDGEENSSSSSLEERRRYLQWCEKYIRSKYGCHLVVPGKNQKGPVAIVGKTYKDAAIPAVAWLLQHITLPPLAPATTSTDPTSSQLQEQQKQTTCITGRIQLDVKDPRQGNNIIHGRWYVVTINNDAKEDFGDREDDDEEERDLHAATRKCLNPYWLFESETWNVMACPLPTESKFSANTTMTNMNMSPNSPLGVLISCVDDVRFQLGQRSFDDIDIFLDDGTNKNDRHDAHRLPTVFAAAGGGDQPSSSSALEAMKRLFLQIQSIEI